MTSAPEKNELLQRLPHRDPFVFVSELLELTPQRRGTALWLIRGTESFFAGHFPGNPIVPGVLLGESLAQLAGLVAFGNRPQTGLAAHARLARIDVKLPNPVVPPAEVHLEAVQSRMLDAMVMFDVRATAKGEVVATGSLVLVCPIVPPNPDQSPEIR